MRSLLLASLAVAALIAAPATSFALSSKAAAVAGEVAAIPDDGQFHTIFSTDIRTSKQKDLFMQVNLECALETRPSWPASSATRTSPPPRPGCRCGS